MRTPFTSVPAGMQLACQQPLESWPTKKQEGSGAWLGAKEKVSSRTQEQAFEPGPAALHAPHYRCCLARTKTMPATRPTPMEATFWGLQGWLKAMRPTTARGILFSDPTCPGCWSQTGGCAQGAAVPALGI